MFEFTEAVTIDASPDRVWRDLVDVERWWLPSNPEHIRLDVHAPEGGIGLGTEIEIEERVAGLEGQAKGRITGWEEGSAVAWEGEATYRYHGLPIPVREGVTWRVVPRDDETELSATVWADFPTRFLGRFMEWFARTVLRVVERDRAHARRELHYLKGQLDGSRRAADTTRTPGDSPADAR